MGTGGRSFPSPDHSLTSGGCEQGIGRGSGVAHTPGEASAEEVLALAAAVEPVTVLVEVGLQVGGADAVEDIQCPALEIRQHDLQPGQTLIYVGARGQDAGAMAVAGASRSA